MDEQNAGAAAAAAAAGNRQGSRKPTKKEQCDALAAELAAAQRDHDAAKTARADAEKTVRLKLKEMEDIKSRLIAVLSN